ncbi:MAG: cytochrome c, partial [Gammaproteobacteria bacterium]|nr:cytochrome c [Gammaproteobacteria bacterium]
VKSRRAMLTVLKDNFVPLALMALGRIDYNADAAQKYANRLPVMVGMMEERFALDTRGSGVETEALDKIWEDHDAFKAKISNALEAANKLAAVAGDETRFKDAAMDMRSACGSCHDDFRVEQE